MLRKLFKESLNLLLTHPLIFLPGLLSACITSILIFYVSLEIINLEIFEMIRKAIEFLPLFFLYFLINTFLTSLIIRMAYEIKIKKFKLKNCLKVVLKQYLNAFFGFLLFALISCLGLIALIIPGIVLMTKLFFYQCIILIEEKGVFYSFKKSWKLTRVHWYRVLILLASYYLIWLLLKALFYFPYYLTFFFWFFLTLIFIPLYFTLVTLTFLKVRRSFIS